MGRISKLDLSVISNLNYIKQSNISNISNISNFNTLVKNFRDNCINIPINSPNTNSFNTNKNFNARLWSNFDKNLTNFPLKTTNVTDGGTSDSPLIINGFSSIGPGILATSRGLYRTTTEDYINWKLLYNNSFNESINFGAFQFFLSSGIGIYYYNNGTITKSTSYPNGYFTDCILCPDNTTFVIGGASTTPGLYYSTNGTTYSASNITTGDCNRLSIIGNKTIAFMNNGIYYSTNGKTWTQFSGMTGNSTGRVISDNLIVAFVVGKGFYTYKNDGSFTLTQTSEATTGGECSFTEIRNYRVHDKPYIIIAGLGNLGLWYSTDYGKTYKKSNITSGNFVDIKVFGQTVLAADRTNRVLYYSNDCGTTWNKVTGSEGTTSIASIDSHLGIANKIIIGGSYGIKYIDISGVFTLTDEAQKAYDILYNQTSWKNEDITNNPILADAFLKYLGYYPSISPNVLPPNINSSTPVCYRSSNTYRGQTGSNAVIKWDNKVKENYDENGVLKLGNAPYFEFAEKYSTKTKTYEKYGGGGLSRTELIHRFNEVMKHNIRELYKLTTIINPETDTPYIVEVGFANNVFESNSYIPSLDNYDLTKTIILYYPKMESSTDSTNNIKTFDVLFDNYVNTNKEFTIQDMVRLKDGLYPINCVTTSIGNTNYVRRNRGFFMFKSNSDSDDGFNSNTLYNQDTLLVFIYRSIRRHKYDGIINLIIPFDCNKIYSLNQTRMSETNYGGIIYFSRPEEFDYLPYY